MMRLLLLAAFAVPLLAQEQKEPPKTARQVCERIESNMESSYRLSDQVESAIFESEDTARRKEGFAQLEAVREHLERDQLAWQRLGCVQILYPPGNNRP